MAYNYFVYKELLDNLPKDKLSKKIAYETRIQYSPYPNNRQTDYPDIHLSLHYNDILIIRPDSFSIVNTKWYSTPTTRKRFQEFCPLSRSSIHSTYPCKQLDKYFDYVFFGLNYQTTSTVTDVRLPSKSSNELQRLDLSRTITHSLLKTCEAFLGVYPLYENMTFNYPAAAFLTTEQVGLTSLQRLYAQLDWSTILYRNPTNQLFKKLTLEAILLGTQINLGVLFGSNIKPEDRFILDNHKTHRNLKKLKHSMYQEISEWIDLLPTTREPHLIWFVFNSQVHPPSSLDQFKSLLCLEEVR